MKRLAICMALSATLAGCAGPSSMTRYQEMGWMGGTLIEPGADGTILFRAHGNGYTPQAAMDDYVMLRAAEYALEQGRNCFEIVARGSQMNEVSIPGYYGGAIVHNKPSGRVRIRLSDQTSSCGEGGAQAVVARLRPRVQNLSAYFQN